MKPIFIQELKLNARSMFFWCLGMALLIAVGIAEFSTCVGSEESLMPMLLAMPKIIRVMFGMNAIPIDTPLGYFACMLLWYEFVAYFYAAFLGSSILAREERDRTADYIFTKPYSRSTVITGKVLAALLNLVIMNLLTWIASIIFFGNTDGFDPIYMEISLLMIGMFFVQLLYFSISLCISAFANTQKSASSFSMLVVLAGYLTGIALEYQECDGLLEVLSPFRYFYAASIEANGIRIIFIIFSVVLSGISLWAAYWKYNQKDIAV